jgi:trehalose 2-sulfotransferase
MWLRYRTNDPEFDFPFFAGWPPVRYVLAATPRCGSNMITRALWHTGMAGFAEDYFADEYVLDYLERWDLPASDPDILIDVYLQKLMTVRTSPNGVFGVKMQGGHLRALETDLHELLASPHYIWIQRRDRLRQAISYVLAKRTGAWILDGTYLPIRKALPAPSYSYDEIRDHVRLLDNDVMAWEDYFTRHGVAPHVVVYEDLLENYEENIASCLKTLGIHAPGKVPAPGIRRQAGDITERWVEMYRHDEDRQSRRTVGRMK